MDQQAFILMRDQINRMDANIEKLLAAENKRLGVSIGVTAILTVVFQIGALFLKH